MEPVHIAGNLYYVGAADVSSFLITTPAGHILLDSGFDESVPIVEANIRKLGFRVEDIRFLLVSHAHYDHVGGMAKLKAHTHAKLVAGELDAPQLARGGKDDFAWGDKYAFAPVRADRLVRNGDQVRLGDVVLTAYHTPGHTPGCTSWAAVIDQRHVVIPCSLSAPGYQLVNNEKYPRIVADYETSFARLRALPCDIYLGGHSWDFDLHRKRQAGPDAFIDPQGYRAYLDRAEKAFRDAIAKQRAALK